MLWSGRRWLATTIPRMTEVSIDGRVLAVALIISVVSGVLFGVVPAMRAARGDLVSGLRDGGRGMMGSISHDRVRRALIVGEIALSFALLVTAGLLSRSYLKLVSVPNGFDADGLVSGLTWLPTARYPDSLSQAAFWNRLTGALAESMGPRAVTLTNDLPVGGGTSGTVMVEGKETSDDHMPVAEKRIVAANYFDVIGARIARGRSFQSTDVLGAAPVVVVNQAFVNRWMPGENPIGKRLGFAWGIDGYQTIVGVVADVREGRLDEQPKPAIYISTQQRPSDFMAMVVRTTRPEADAMRRCAPRCDASIPRCRSSTRSACRTGCAPARSSGA